MFHSFIEEAKLTASATVSRITGRAVVAILFLIAAGFGVAAIAVQLSAVFGVLTAMGMLAGAFAVIGVIAYLFVLANDRHNQVLIHRASADQAAVTSNLVAVAPVVLAGGLRLIGRAPLVVSALLLGAYFLSNTAASAQRQPPLR